MSTTTTPVRGGAFRDRNENRQDAPGLASSLIAQVKQRMPIEDIVGQYVKLKPVSGSKELVGLCNFHEDDTPSMYISPDKGAFYCHGCGETGNVIHFLAHMNGVDYKQQKLDLAKELGLAFDKPQDPGIRILDASVDRYRNGLSRNSAAQEYLVKRGISVKSADKFGIGYCWGDEFAKATEDTVKAATKAGLYSVKSGRSYLGGRITFPIRARDGRVIAFGGRVLERAGGSAPADPMKKGPPKYLNTPETEYFNKSEILYGMYEARAAISRERKAVVVEGYMDVIGLNQAGAENTVGVMGANANEKAFATLWNVTNNIVFCLDGDAAGRQGTLRSISAAAPPMKDGQTISVAFLPEGIDPDEFVIEHGIQAYNNLIDTAIPLSRYLADQSRVRFNLDDAEGRAAFLEDMRNAAAMFPNAPALKSEIERQAETTCAAHVIKHAFNGAGVQLSNADLAASLAAMRRLQSVQDPAAYAAVYGPGTSRVAKSATPQQRIELRAPALDDEEAFEPPLVAPAASGRVVSAVPVRPALVALPALVTAPAVPSTPDVEASAQSEKPTPKPSPSPSMSMSPGSSSADYELLERALKHRSTPDYVALPVLKLNHVEPEAPKRRAIFKPRPPGNWN